LHAGCAEAVSVMTLRKERLPKVVEEIALVSGAAVRQQFSAPVGRPDVAAVDGAQGNGG